MPSTPHAAPPPSTQPATRIGVRDVARLAGVSPMSVSRAINKPEMVSPAIRERVRLAIEKTGFVGNRLASSLAADSSGLIGLIVPAVTGPAFQLIIQAVFQQFAAHGHHVLLGQAGYGVQENDRLLDTLLSRRPAGLILVGVTPSAEGRHKLERAGIPTVQTWDLPPDPIDLAVGFSHPAIAAAAVRHLVDAGCRELVFLGGLHRRARARAEAFEQAARAAGVRATLCELAAPAGVENARLAWRDIAARNAGVDGVFCSSDLVAYGVCQQAQEDGRRVPHDLKVLGLGDIPFAADVSPSISTVVLPVQQIAGHAVDYILRRARGEQPPRQHVDAGFHLLARETTASA